MYMYRIKNYHNSLIHVTANSACTCLLFPVLLRKQPASGVCSPFLFTFSSSLFGEAASFTCDIVIGPWRHVHVYTMYIVMYIQAWTVSVLYIHIHLHVATCTYSYV